jgi:hypothetical protein
MRALAGEEPVAEPAVARGGGGGGGGGGAVPVDLRHGSRQDGHRRPVLHLLSRHNQGHLTRSRSSPETVGYFDLV